MDCECGAAASHESPEGGGICADCYKTLAPEERRRWIERKLRGVARAG